ncbi:type II toxin-antitoxin system PemK/MazF family toxin [Arenibaculum sp.]|jgi:uncharacterized protein YifN (PemK superfamily)|uniref:type II toxin-antitoxin system PemK/MazF family toxin n=1 Tax=Arenibaculum sp. TaxID=2865862 RepID=UPI002E130C79|nr:type II toxin-antitoxin system PemK/MazF family toxin [Arenibaculum sp.]
MPKGQQPHWNPVRISIQRAPRAAEVYWIGMFDDSVEPEFTGYHPGVLIRGCPDLDEKTACVSFVPLTSTKPRVAKPYHHPLAINPNPVSDVPVWAVCNHIYTVRIHRLERYYDGRRLVVPKLPAAKMLGVARAIASGCAVVEGYVRNEVARREAEMRTALQAEYDERFESEVEARATRELDRLTAPPLSPAGEA